MTRLLVLLTALLSAPLAAQDPLPDLASLVADAGRAP